MDTFVQNINELFGAKLTTDELYIAALVFGVTLLLGLIAKQLILYALTLTYKRTHLIYIKIVQKQIGRFPNVLIGFVALYTGSFSLTFEREGGLFRAFELIILIATVFFSVRILNAIIRSYTKRKSNEIGRQSEANAFQFISVLVQVTVWVLAVVSLLSTLGYDVSAIVAGLGLSGLAIAFALRSTIKDIIASFVIIFDKPVQIGDTIEVGEKSGVVEKIGIKSVRVRAEDNNMLVVPNSEIVEKIVKNYKNDNRKLLTLEIDFNVEKYEYNKARRIISEAVSKLTEEFDPESVNFHLTKSEEEAHTFSVQIFYNSTPKIDESIDMLFEALYDVGKKEELTIKRIERVES